MMKNETLKTIFQLVKRDIDATDDNDETSLMLAVREGSVDLVRDLITAGARINKQQERNRDGSSGSGQTALILAAIGGHEEIVQILLEAAADTSLKDHAGYDAAYYAKKGKFDGITALLEQVENDRLLMGIKAHLKKMAPENRTL